MGNVRIVIADDQALILDGIKIILDAEPDFSVVAVAKDGFDALEAIKEYQPDIALLDIRMPKMNGVECAKQIKYQYPFVKVILLTTFNDEEYIVDAFKYGVDGYLLKDITREKLVQAIRDAHNGEMLLPSKIAVKLAQSVHKVQHKDNVQIDAFDFTPRERQVAELLAQGYTNKQISTALSFSEGTVKNSVSSIYSKINIFDRTSAALFLKSQGM